MARGGLRENAGRKPVADEEKANAIMLTALRQLYSTDNDDDAKVKFIKDTLLETQRGQIFVAEHIFGKPKETVDSNINLNNLSLKDIVSFDKS